MTKDVKDHRQEQQQAVKAIGRHVLRRLGRPPELQRVQVKHLWGACYRINIFTGLDFMTSKMAHSYFLVTNETGAVLEAMPPLVRAYAVADENDPGGVDEPH